MSNGEHITESSTLAGATTEPEPGVESNPGEFAVIWNRRTEEQRSEMLRNMRSAVHRSNWCILGDHDGRIENLEQRLAEVRAERDALRQQLDALAAAAIPEEDPAQAQQEADYWKWHNEPEETR
ncbi:hypothetical protein [Leifsonia sp. P73]|uniref:hypothetical protein n=1 Tax=Leifsonia sp. P73 TaxID=3423959 RepID=UPI003DA26757